MEAATAPATTSSSSSAVPEPIMQALSETLKSSTTMTEQDERPASDHASDASSSDHCDNDSVASSLEGDVDHDDESADTSEGRFFK